MNDRCTRVYILAPRWFLRPGNTDWAYTRLTLPRITEFAPDCEMYPSRSLVTALRVNLRYASRFAQRRLRTEWKCEPDLRLDREEFNRSRCDLVFCHDEYPSNAQSLPVVWQNSILDPRMGFANGRSAEEMKIEFTKKESGFKAAAAVLVSTAAERDRLRQWFPKMAEKFVAIPFFLPDVHPIAAAEWEQKASLRLPLRCLFVGHEARRKGLQRVYDALLHLPAAVRGQIHLTVVSRHRDGTVRAPNVPNLRIESSVSNREVLQLMRSSHVLLMPSHFESYGLVFLEAMAYGTIPVVPDWEAQREIVANGAAGIITTGDPKEIAFALERLCEDEVFRRVLSWNALRRFEQCFEPSLVGRKLHSLFRRVALLHPANTRGADSLCYHRAASE